MIIFYFVAVLILIGFIVFLINKFRSDKKFGTRFYDFRGGNATVYAMLLLFTGYFVVVFSFREPDFDDPAGLIRYGSETGQPWMVTKGYKALAKKDTFNLENHYQYIKSYFDERNYMAPDRRVYNRESLPLYEYYTWLSKSNHPTYSDIGNNFLAIYYIFRNDFVNARVHIAKVADTTMRYYSYAQGRIKYYYNDTPRSLSALRREQERHGPAPESILFRSLVYHFENMDKELSGLVNSPSESVHTIPFLRRKVYSSELNIAAYFTEQFNLLVRRVNLPGFLGAFLILIIWISYLRRVNINQNTRFTGILLALVLTILLELPTWMLYDVYHYLFDFALNGEVVNDFLYCVFGIGFIEELIKIIPYLLILGFTRLIRQPSDHIIYASLCGLGFAFIENFQYFFEHGIQIVHSRALTASIAHMVFTSCIAYGVILARYRYKRNAFLYFSLFFLLAIFLHGFYDFWLLNEAVKDYWLVTFLMLLSSILVYASFLNNALNHSVTAESRLNLRTSKLTSDLAGGLIFVFVFEFLAVSWIYGPTIGERELITSVLGGGYMLLFVSVRLSNLDIFPGEWAPIELFAGLTPAHILASGRKPDFNSMVGKRIEITSMRKGSKLEGILPLTGAILTRKKMDSFTGWFQVRLDKEMNTTAVKDHIYIRPKDPGELMDEHSTTIIAFSLIPLSLVTKDGKRKKEYSFVDWAHARLLPEGKVTSQ